MSNWRVPLALVSAMPPILTCMRHLRRKGIAAMSVRSGPASERGMLPFADLHVSTEPGVISKVVLTLMAQSWSGADIKISLVTGGLTNKLYCATLTEGERSMRTLVRIFGAEGMIDRVKENATAEFLGESGVGPRCLGRFRNGRLETWLEGCKPLTLIDLSHAETSRSIAGALARLHAIQLPANLKEKYYGGGPGVWSQLDLWLKQAQAQDPDAKDCKLNAAEKEKFRQLDLISIGDEIRTIRARLDAQDCAVRFCHNDCLYGNIMRHTSGAVHLIDFEYGGLNFVSFDIANHFNEWAGGTGIEKSGPGYNGVPDYQRLPSPVQQDDFCRAYLEEVAAATGTGELGPRAVISEATVQALVDEVQEFMTVNHFYWGLWGLNQAFDEGCESFNYLQYGCSRIQQSSVLKGAADNSRAK